MQTAPEKFPKSSLFGGIVFLLFGAWLVYAARGAAAHGDVISTEWGAGWITPTAAYIVAIGCLCIAAYLLVGYIRHHRKRTL